MLLLAAAATLFVQDWAFNPAQLEMLYARNYRDDQPRLQEAWTPRPDGSAIGEGVEIPSAFIAEVRGHIQELLDAGRARHLFFLDFSHLHVYGTAGLDRAAALTDPESVLVYHTQEMWETWDHPREFHSRRGVLRAAENAPPGLTHLFHVRFRAHPRGAYALRDGTRYDLSFQDDTWEQGAERLGFVMTY